MTFEEYVLTRGPALVRLARLLVGDDHRAEDLVQDVLARAYPRWARISRADQPDLYLRRMLVNARNSWWRRRANRELAVAELADRAGPDDSAAAADRDAMWRLVRGYPRASGRSWCCASMRTSTTRPSRRSWGARRSPSERTRCVR